MPTGYTAIIEENPNCTLKDYILRCSRAFGALISMKEDRLDAPLPDKLVPDSYYQKQYSLALEKLDAVKNLTLKEVKVAVEREYQDKIASRIDYIKTKNIKTAQYDAMREEVKSWIPPSPKHEDLKTFMLQQLDISWTSWDRNYVPEVPKKITPKEHKQFLIKDAENRVEFCKKQWEEEILRTEERNEWLDQLYRSIGVKWVNE